MDLRIEFMQRLARKERVSDLCREYGISRKTGHKFKKRFERYGVAGLEDQSKAPKVIPHKTSPEIEELVIAERKQHPTWGAKKLKELLELRFEHPFPSATAIGNILERNGLIQKRKRREGHKSAPTMLREATAPNDVWCIDYKGQFRLGDTTYCYPLTLTDQFSRFILGCEGMAAISDEAARDVCEELFREHGLPAAMRSDNGAPFASTGLRGLTKLSVFWIRLGIQLERIRPAHPEENGRHERMHRTLKFETARPSRANLLQQQERFDEFVQEFNFVRPHEALDMKRPADVYGPSLRPFPSKLNELRYPTHDDVLRVKRGGQIYIGGIGSVPISYCLAGEYVGIREERDGRWLVSFAELDLCHVHPNKTVTPIASSPPEAEMCNPCT
ncbi:MAG: IS481 family transposase [Gemmatimonadales bacterium]